MPKSKSVPAYKLHKSSGQARVIINGQHIYLGPFGSVESKEKYARLLAEYATAPAVIVPTTADPELTIKELAASYWTFAEAYYVKNGKPTGHLAMVRRGLKAIKELYATLPVQEFGPLKLAAVQQSLVAKGCSRGYVNDTVATIRRMFKWATSKELLPPAIHQALATLPGLKKGRTAAREPEPIGPVSVEIVESTLPYMPPIIGDMVRLQRATGARPDEVCILRPCDIDRSGKVWRYVPESHKTEHHDKQRVILIGPKGQAILRPYLLRDAQAYCFSPAEAEAARNAEKRASRKSPMTPSQKARSKSRKPRRPPGDHYPVSAYRRAIHRACDLADLEAHTQANEGCPADKPNVAEAQRIVPRWSPNRLRHSAATEIRQRFGLEAAQVVLGHSKADVTQVYAERDLQKAAAIMAEVG